MIECISFCLAIAACISHESARRSVISDKPLHIDVLRNINVIFYSAFIPSFLRRLRTINRRGCGLLCIAALWCTGTRMGWDRNNQTGKRVPPSVHVSKNKLRFAFCIYDNVMFRDIIVATCGFESLLGDCKGTHLGKRLRESRTCALSLQEAK